MAISKTNTKTIIMEDVEWSQTKDSKEEKVVFSYKRDGENNKTDYLSLSQFRSIGLPEPLYPNRLTRFFLVRA